MNEPTPQLDWITLAAASRAWRISRSSIIWAYWRGSLSMVKVGGTWLVYWPHMVIQWGNPQDGVELEPLDTPHP